MEKVCLYCRICIRGGRETPMSARDQHFPNTTGICSVKTANIYMQLNCRGFVFIILLLQNRLSNFDNFQCIYRFTRSIFFISDNHDPERSVGGFLMYSCEHIFTFKMREQALSKCHSTAKLQLVINVLYMQVLS